MTLPSSPRRGRAAFSCLHIVLLAVLLASCAPNAPQDTLKPEGSIARDINNLFWPVFWIGVGVFFLVEGALVFALLRFREKKGSSPPEQVHGNTKLEIAWTIAPSLILTFVAVATVVSIFDIARRPSGDVLEVRVVAHQWWWEYEYTGLEVVTANELHIPTGKAVYLSLESQDVIHSFWIPKLAGKQDVVPGRTNTLTIRAEEPGTYLGQCAEFCGLSHANMRLRVIAQNPEDFDGWVADQREGAPEPADSLAARGRDIFMDPQRCAQCHAIGGTVAAARTAPDLTHFASRTTFAGAMFENTPENLARWLRDPPAMKPMSPDRGIGMPDYDLNEEEIDALIAYLETLQ